jgi:hypothetical protein
MADGRPSSAPRSAFIKSRVSNGRSLFAPGEADGRGAWARRFRDLVDLHAEDMGGRDTLSEAQISLIRRAAAIEVELERYEGQMSQGEPVDLDMFARTSSHLRRILETVGVRRVQRDLTPRLADLIASTRKSSS